MLSMRSWQHERVIEPLDGSSCALTDTLTFVLRAPLDRVPGSTALAKRIVTFLFRHRHRRLVRVHGATQGESR